MATAAHALKEYDVFGRGDWRQREEVRNLPERDRNDLALWLMEQTFRYCRALGDRPDSPGDWRRAIAMLDRVSTTPPLQAFETLRRRLHARLGQSGTPDSQAQEQIALPPEPDAGPAEPRRGDLPSRRGSKTTCWAWPLETGRRSPIRDAGFAAL